MRYVIQFVQEGQPYFAFPFGGAGDLQTLAGNITKMYFIEGSDEPQAVPPNSKIPNEVRVVDDAGWVVAQSSLVDEYERRQLRGANAKVVSAVSAM
jgi:hypothetical protein